MAVVNFVIYFSVTPLIYQSVLELLNFSTRVQVKIIIEIFLRDWLPLVFDSLLKVDQILEN